MKPPEAMQARADCFVCYGMLVRLLALRNQRAHRSIWLRPWLFLGRS